MREIHGINPRLIYPNSGVSFDLPRFCSVEMQQARAMNKIAKRNMYQIYSNRVPPKATSGDIERLTAMDYDSTQRRAVWIDPKTFKPYYLLKENSSENLNELRVLDGDGTYLKNITVKPNDVILCDLSEGDKAITNILDVNFNHSDLMGTCACSYNPFSNYTIYKINKDDELIEMTKELPKTTSCVVFSYGIFRPTDSAKTGKEIEREVLDEIEKLPPVAKGYLSNMRDLSGKVRTLACAGNTPNELNSMLLKTGIEGVGGLNSAGVVDSLSGSRSSYFTQHYEPFVYPIKTTVDGVNITGMRGTDIMLPHDYQEDQYLGKFRGTSFSTPVRAAKLALDGMMRGCGL